MVTDANRNIISVEHLPHVMRMHTLDCEGEDTDALQSAARPEDPHSLKIEDLFEEAGGELFFLSADPVHAELRKVFEGCGPACDLGDRL